MGPRGAICLALLVLIGGRYKIAGGIHQQPPRHRAAPSAARQVVSLGRGFYLERSSDDFGIRSHGIVEKTKAGPKFYPLPQSDAQSWRRLRAEDLKNWGLPPTAGNYQRQEVIGPYQVEGSRVWFGNQYYDGEGDTGIGAFGYFDFETRRYTLFSPPEIARWEISALLVDGDMVWLGLDHFGEDISKLPRGLARWNRNTHQVQRYPLEFLIEHIRRDTKDASELVLSAPGGYALFRDGEVKRFRIQETADGKEIAVHIERFPPSPSKY